jgi:hypothetical protein
MPRVTSAQRKYNNERTMPALSVCGPSNRIILNTDNTSGIMHSICGRTLKIHNYDYIIHQGEGATEYKNGWW